jgi:hypothetical protein
MAQDADAPKLQPPGAGIPLWHELFLRRWFLPRYVRRHDWATRQGIYRRHGEKLMALCRSQPPERLNTRALVAPAMGLEDSSRYWSVAMVVEHLIIVGSLQARLIHELSFGRVPAEEASIAAVKPKGAVGLVASLPRFAALLDEFDALLATGLGDRDSAARFAHPWFGPLTAAGWHAVAALHQGLHRRQAQAIVGALGASL